MMFKYIVPTYTTLRPRSVYRIMIVASGLGNVENPCFNASDFYSRGAHFRTSIGTPTNLTKTAVIFLRHSRQVTRYYVGTGHGRFFPNPLQFTEFHRHLCAALIDYVQSSRDLIQSIN
jgi:hypothetical protein